MQSLHLQATMKQASHDTTWHQPKVRAASLWRISYEKSMSCNFIKSNCTHRHRSMFLLDPHPSIRSRARRAMTPPGQCIQISTCYEQTDLAVTPAYLYTSFKNQPDRGIGAWNQALTIAGLRTPTVAMSAKTGCETHAARQARANN
jgi:hypothetical protein